MLILNHSRYISINRYSCNCSRRVLNGLNVFIFIYSTIKNEGYKNHYQKIHPNPFPPYNKYYNILPVRRLGSVIREIFSNQNNHIDQIYHSPGGIFPMAFFYKHPEDNYPQNNKVNQPTIKYLHQRYKHNHPKVKSIKQKPSNQHSHNR
jgi:hypothetical protein